MMIEMLSGVLLAIAFQIMIIACAVCGAWAFDHFCWKDKLPGDPEDRQDEWPWW